MIWLVWRRQRAALLTAAGLVAVFAVVLVVGRVAFVTRMRAHGIDEACSHLLSEACRTAATTVFNGDLATPPTGFGPFWGLSHSALQVVPLVVGLLAGAGLFRRELDDGTYALALTQSVTVTRWWTTGLLVAGVAVAVLLVPLGLVAEWAYAPFALITSPFSPLETPLFEISGVVPVAYGVLAFALAAGTGLVARGTLAPVVVAVTGYIMVMFVLATVARPQYLPVETVRQVVDYSRSDLGISDVAGTWKVERRWVDDQGATRALTACNEGMSRCLQDAGVTGYEVRTQPDGRYWMFQLIETAILLALSAGALALTHPRLVSRMKDGLAAVGDRR
jgi:hypothetical protein